MKLSKNIVLNPKDGGKRFWGILQKRLEIKREMCYHDIAVYVQMAWMRTNNFIMI